jgi:hypothetical protein
MRPNSTFRKSGAKIVIPHFPLLRKVMQSEEQKLCWILYQIVKNRFVFVTILLNFS